MKLEDVLQVAVAPDGTDGSQLKAIALGQVPLREG
jgi:hypothetical protein